MNSWSHCVKLEPSNLKQLGLLLGYSKWVTSFTKYKNLSFWRIFKTLPNYTCGPVIRGVCPHNNWLSFVLIFLKLYMDTTNIKKTFFRPGLGGGGGGHSPKMGQVGGTHPNYFRGWRTVCLVHWLPAWWPLGLPWWPTENAAMLQCYMQSLYLHSALCLLFLCHCCILSEIKLTTTSTTLKLHCTLLKMGELVGGGTHTHWCVCVCGGGGGGGGGALTLMCLLSYRKYIISDNFD